MKQTMKLRSGATIPQITPEEANRKSYLTRNVLNMMHLMPSGDPVAYDENADGSITERFVGDKTITKTITFNSDGSITEVIS